MHDLTEECMSLAQTKSEKLHALTLQLQNLQYERGHYNREIKECQNFGYVLVGMFVDVLRSKELAELDFASLEEYKEVKGTDVPEDPHEIMLGRLRLELDQRKAYVASTLRISLSEWRTSSKNFVSNKKNCHLTTRRDALF